MVSSIGAVPASMDDLQHVDRNLHGNFLKSSMHPASVEAERLARERVQHPGPK